MSGGVGRVTRKGDPYLISVAMMGAFGPELLSS
jgi:hypothetical protein